MRASPNYSISILRTTKLGVARKVAIAAAALLALFASVLPASAEEVSMDCGYGTGGYGGTYESPNNTAYTVSPSSGSSECNWKYLVGQYSENGLHAYGQGYTTYSQNVEVYGAWASSTHRLCTGDFGICSQFKGTFDS
jgi:hypothetical protein